MLKMQCQDDASVDAVDRLNEHARPDKENVAAVAKWSSNQQLRLNSTRSPLTRDSISRKRMQLQVASLASSRARNLSVGEFEAHDGQISLV